MKGIIALEIVFIIGLIYTYIQYPVWNILPYLWYTAIPWMLYIPLIILATNKVNEKINDLIAQFDIKNIVATDKKSEYENIKSLLLTLIYGKPMKIFMIFIAVAYIGVYRLLFFFPRFFENPESMVGFGSPPTLEFQIVSTYASLLNLLFAGTVSWIILSFFIFTILFQKKEILNIELTKIYISVGIVPDYLYSFGGVSVRAGIAVLTTMLLIPNFVSLRYLPFYIIIGVIAVYFLLTIFVVLAPMLGFVEPINKIRNHAKKIIYKKITELVYRTPEKLSMEFSEEDLSYIVNLSDYYDIYVKLENMPMFPLKESDKKKIGYAYLIISAALTIFQNLPALPLAIIPL